ncbi:MAG: Ig-like domain-containing protein [Lachnospiraceae bacterium]|nr:Ig-like domain-containing protein [Lachnospiraceae bacterium]
MTEKMQGSDSGLDPFPHSEASETTIRAWFVKGQSYNFRRGEWQNGDKKIASVTKTGTITAKNVGTTVLKWLSPGGENIDMIVNVAEIAISQKSMKLLVGEKSEPLKVVFKGASPEYYSVSFTSSNPAVASVDETGTVTGVGKGSATIYGWSGGRSVACKVSVTDNAASLNPKKLSYGASVSIGALQSYAPKYVTSSGRAFKAKNATWGWSDDPNAALEDVKDMTPVENKGKIKGYTNGIIEVDAANGKLKAVGPGTTTIFGIEKVDSPGLDNITKLTVTVRAVPTQSTIYVSAGKTVAVKFAGVKNDKAEWSITDIDGEPGCITLEQKNGKYTGKVKTVAGTSGSAEVTCSCGGFTWKSVVCAENPTLKESDITMSEYGAIDLQGVYQKPLWKSADNDVVFVDESGSLYGRSPGKTTVQTKIGGKTLKLNVTVQP